MNLLLYWSIKGPPRTSPLTKGACMNHWLTMVPRRSPGFLKSPLILRAVRLNTQVTTHFLSYRWTKPEVQRTKEERWDYGQWVDHDILSVNHSCVGCRKLHILYPFQSKTFSLTTLFVLFFISESYSRYQRQNLYFRQNDLVCNVAIRPRRH